MQFKLSVTLIAACLLAAAAAAAAVPPPPAAAAATALLAAGAQAVLNAHNTYRALHRSPPLVWDSVLAAHAAAHASRCDFRHDANLRKLQQGENLFATGNVGNSDAAMLAAVQAWYIKESQQYDYSLPDQSSATDRFTTVVWKSTTHIGCAAASCPKGVKNFDYPRGTVVVCRYSPPGNLKGGYLENVLRPVM